MTKEVIHASLFFEGQLLAVKKSNAPTALWMINGYWEKKRSQVRLCVEERVQQVFLWNPAIKSWLLY